MNSRLMTLLAVVVLGSACTVKNGFTVEPIGFCAPATDAKNCSSSGSCATFLAGQGFYYLYVLTGTTSFVLNGDMGYFMQFDNQAIDTTDNPTGRVNTTDAVFEGVSLSYAVHASAATAAFALPDVVESVIPYTIRSQSTGTPFVTLIPISHTALMSAAIATDDEVLVDITVRGRGKYGDQSSFVTAPVVFPVWVSNRIFPGYVCDTAGATVTAVCPGPGQAGATFTCSGTTAAGTFTLGGTISGLTGSGLVLGATGLSDQPVNAGSTTFTFTGGLADGATYTVTVVTQPTGQVCTVTGGSGTISGANVSSVQVTCV